VHCVAQHVPDTPSSQCCCAGWAVLPARRVRVVADTEGVMALRSLPTAFGYLVDEKNAAADAALVNVLPHLEPFAQAAALEILLIRGHSPSLARVVGRLNDYGDGLQRLIFARAKELSAGMRVAIVSPSYQERASAIETIVRGDAGRSAYLLADALRSRCGRTRELAASGLHRMTARLLERLDAGPFAAEIGELDARANGLAEALGTAVQRWEIHLQPKVLEAALWLGDRVEPAILKKLQERRTKIARVLNDLLEGTSDPRLAGFVLRALAISVLRSAAARAISRTRDIAFLRAVFTESWLLTDARIEQGCRRIRDGQWLRSAVDVLLMLDESAVCGAVSFLAAVGGRPERRIELFRELVGMGRAKIRRAVLWRLIHDNSEAATDLLTVMAARPGDSVAMMAAREVRRRRPGLSPPIASSALRSEPALTATTRDLFDRYWKEFDDPNADKALAVNVAVRRLSELGLFLRAKLASGEPLDRARALQIALGLGALKELEESVQRLTYDSDPIVRGLAVSMLAKLPGATAERLLRTAVNDPDYRVAANAIEGLDRLDVADRVALTEPKLKSANSRVRANAVKSLLRAELRQAGEVLLDMLEDQSTAHRRSALWVVEQLGSRVALGRVRGMSRNDPDEWVRKQATRVCGLIASDLASHPRLSGDGRRIDRIHSAGGTM